MGYYYLSKKLDIWKSKRRVISIKRYHPRVVFVLLIIIVWLQKVSSAKNNIFSVIQRKVQSSPMGNIVRMAKYDRAANMANAITALQLLNHDLKWHRLDDGVMGGRSETTLQTDTTSLHFQGTINTNGGGFTSIRAPLPLQLSDNMTALRIRFRGDGKTYKVLLSDGNGLRSPSWQIDLPTHKESNVVQEVELPLHQFQPSFGPRKVSDSDLNKYKLIPSEMKELGFMLSLKLSDGTSNPEETFGKDIFDFSLIIESIDITVETE